MNLINEINHLSGEAFALLFRSAPGYFARLSRCSALILTGEAFADLNYFFIGAEPNAIQTLHEGITRVRELSLPVLTLFTPDVATSLAVHAHNLSMSPAGEVPIMTLEPSKTLPVQPNFCINPIECLATLAMASRIDSAGFGLPNEVSQRLFTQEMLDAPGVKLFIAYQDHIPISAVQTVRSGNSVGVFSMSTRPEYQRQGAGKALLSQVINEFLLQGVSRFYLGSTIAGFRLYESIGFQTIGYWSVWSIGESTQCVKT